MEKLLRKMEPWKITLDFYLNLFPFRAERSRVSSIPEAYHLRNCITVVYAGFRGMGVPGAMGGSFLYRRKQKFPVFSN